MCWRATSLTALSRATIRKLFASVPRQYEMMRSIQHVLMEEEDVIEDSVALVKCEGHPKAALQAALRLIGGFKPSKSQLIIKPNICVDVDETGVANTKVDIVESLIALILEENKRLPIRIVEADSMSKFADQAFARFGYRGFADRLSETGFDVSLVNLSQSTLKQVKLEGLYFQNPELPAVLTEPGSFVSVAVPKTHSLTLATGVLKNFFGLLPRKDKVFYHPYINEVIVDINRLVRSDLCLVDARVGLEGVVKGKPRTVNALILGRRPVSVDATMVRLMGFQPGGIRHLVEAEKYGLGTLHPNVLGESLESIKVDFKSPSKLKPTALVN
jgi:uncharacterized protein (DUF362 family)